MTEVNKLSINCKELVEKWHNEPKKSRDKELIKIIWQINKI